MDRARRATRGQRMHKLIGEEKDQDDEFWGHSVWNEDDEDDFELDAVEMARNDDSADSDFSKEDDNEQGSDSDEEENQVRREERKAARRGKRTGYQDPNRNKRRSKRPLPPPPQLLGDEKGKGEAKEEEEDDDDDEGEKKREGEGGGEEEDDEERGVEASEESSPPPKRRKRAAGAAPTDRQVRSSTRSLTQAKRERRVKHEQREQERREQSGRRARNEAERRLTQEDLLAEAALTEQYNIAYLKELERCEDEQKKKVLRKETVRTGPYLRYHSSPKGTLVTFFNQRFLPSTVRAPPLPYPSPKVCAVTGLPARYFDPVTKLPYVDLQAFRALRNGHRGKPPSR